jgi:acetyltransferase-like isoleucine patch superfamily enzyme
VCSAIITRVNLGAVRSSARAVRLATERARFELWARRLDAALRRAGGRLEVQAPHGAHFYDLPRFEIHPHGPGAGTTTLRFGEHVRLGRGLILDLWAGADNLLELGDGAWFKAGTRVHLRGGAVRLGRDVGIRDYCYFDASGGGEIVLGDRVQFGSQVALHAVDRVEMGVNSAAGERVSIFDSDHRHDGGDVASFDQDLAVSPVILGENTFVGANAVLLRGVRIEGNALVAAAALMRHGEYPAGFLYAGVPARSVRPLGEELGARPGRH